LLPVDTPPTDQNAVTLAQFVDGVNKASTAEPSAPAPAAPKIEQEAKQQAEREAKDAAAEAAKQQALGAGKDPSADASTAGGDGGVPSREGHRLRPLRGQEGEAADPGEDSLVRRPAGQDVRAAPRVAAGLTVA